MPGAGPCCVRLGRPSYRGRSGGADTARSVAIRPDEETMTIKVGDRIPDVTLYVMSDQGPQAVKTGEFFKGKKVALFALPGAFTPTCSAKHRSEEHTSELQSLMRISYAVFCLKKKKRKNNRQDKRRNQTNQYHT